MTKAVVENMTKAAAVLALLGYVLGVVAVSVYVQHNDVPAPDLTTFKANYIVTGLEVLAVLAVAGMLIFGCRQCAKGGHPVKAALFGVAFAFGLWVLYSDVLQGARVPFHDRISTKSLISGLLIIISCVGALLAWAILEVKEKDRLTVDDLRRREARPDRLDLKPFVLGICGILLLAAAFTVTDIWGIRIYPLLSPQFGGGKPSRARMVFTHDGVAVANDLGVPLKPGTHLSGPLTILLDSGSFYAVRTPQNLVVQITKADVEGLQADTKPPEALDVQTLGHGSNGSAGPGDRLVLTYSEVMDPNSLIPGWAGTNAAEAEIRVQRNHRSVSVLKFVRPSVNALGNVDFDSGDYAGASGRRNYQVTVEQRGPNIIVTLPSRVENIHRLPPATMTWYPSTHASDLAGNKCSMKSDACEGSPVRESGPDDPDF
jgi:hypothetical protein